MCSLSWGMSLYHLVAAGDAQGMTDVKKLSKESASAADQAQIKTTSTSVCASLPEVRQRPRGRPKYSSYVGEVRSDEDRETESFDNAHRSLL